MFTVFIRAVILYIVLILTVRLMGKRQIGELQPAELAVTILISNIATLPVEDPSLPLMKGLIPILTLGCLDVIMSYLGLRHGRIRTFMSGRPVVIISNGKINQQNMKMLRFTADDLLQAAHGESIFDISEIEYAVVETTGKVSVYPKYESRQVTNADMKLKGNDGDPPSLIIEDGILLEDNLRSLGVKKAVLENELKKKNIGTENIYILTASNSSDGFKINSLIEKEKQQ